MEVSVLYVNVWYQEIFLVYDIQKMCCWTVVVMKFFVFFFAPLYSFTSLTYIKNNNNTLLMFRYKILFFTHTHTATKLTSSTTTLIEKRIVSCVCLYVYVHVYSQTNAF